MRQARYQIHGPLPKHEVKSLLGQAPFKGWEVSGHLGPWISLGNEEKMKTTYAELWKELTTQSLWKKLFQRGAK